MHFSFKQQRLRIWCGIADPNHILNLVVFPGIYVHISCKHVAAIVDSLRLLGIQFEQIIFLKRNAIRIDFQADTIQVKCQAKIVSKIFVLQALNNVIRYTQSQLIGADIAQRIIVTDLTRDKCQGSPITHCMA